jgi:hypothetical protein
MKVTMLQLKMALMGLKFEARTGMKMSAKVNTYRWVADVLGYPRNVKPSKQTLILELEHLISRLETEPAEA